MVAPKIDPSVDFQCISCLGACPAVESSWGGTKDPSKYCTGFECCSRKPGLCCVDVVAMRWDGSLLRRLIMNARAARDARRAAPRAPPTAPPTTAVLSAGHVVPAVVPLLLWPVDATGVTVTVTVAAAAVPTVLVAV